MSDEAKEKPARLPWAADRDFWAIMGYAVIFGIVGAFAGLAFLEVIKIGDLWADDDATGWFDGHWWWIAVTAATGLAVGLIRVGFRMEARSAGLIKEAGEQYVEPSKVPGTVAVSAVSLIGGASLGPEAALGAMGGGFATWFSKWRKLKDEIQRTNTLNGMSGAFGGLLSAPFLATMLIIDLARPGGRQQIRVVMGGSVASIIGFAIFFPIAGTVFLASYKLPEYNFESWQLLAGVVLGLVAAAIAMILAITIGVLKRITSRLDSRTIVRPVIGGIVFGLVAVVLPLTLFTGTSQLETVINDAKSLGTAMLVVLVLGKIFTFAIGMNTGFIGGPLFPSFFIGGTAGMAASLIVPELPVALAFTALLAAVPAAIVPAPFTMVLLAGLLTAVGVLQFTPILVAVVVAYVLISGTGVLAKLQERGSGGEGKDQLGNGEKAPA
jgi:H+/Cl- antiporter ClcA